MGNSDGELIESCLRGEQHGWTTLVSRYQRLIYSVARKLCPQPDDCADVFQFVCLELYQNLDRLRSNQTLPAWLITVTKRRSYVLLRSKNLNVSLDEYEPEAQHQIDRIEKEFALEAAVAELPDRCRNLIELLYFDVEEPSYAVIAEKLGMPVASVGPTRARCLEKLKKILEQ